MPVPVSNEKGSQQEFLATLALSGSLAHGEDVGDAYLTHYFKGGWHLNALQAFIRDGGCCVYCRKPLLDTYGVSKTATIDHLLPTHTYPERGGILIIWFPPVPHAIAIKLHYDPSEGNGKDLVVITAEARLSLIRKAKEEIDRIKRE